MMLVLYLASLADSGSNVLSQHHSKSTSLGIGPICYNSLKTDTHFESAMSAVISIEYYPEDLLIRVLSDPTGQGSGNYNP